MVTEEELKKKKKEARASIKKANKDKTSTH